MSWHNIYEVFRKKIYKNKHEEKKQNKQKNKQTNKHTHIFEAENNEQTKETFQQKLGEIEARHEKITKRILTNCYKKRKNVRVD